MLIYIPEPIKEEIRNRRYWRMIWVRIFLSLGLLASATFALLLAGEYCYFLITTPFPNGVVSKAVSHDHSIRAALLSKALKVPAFISWCMWAIWFTVAYYNTKRFATKTTYPIWTSFSHLLPGFNLVHPQLIMREMILTAKGDSMSARERITLYVWWAAPSLLIIGLMLGVVFTLAAYVGTSFAMQSVVTGIYFIIFLFFLTSFLLVNAVNRYQDQALKAQEQQMQEQQMQSKDNSY